MALQSGVPRHVVVTWLLVHVLWAGSARGHGRLIDPPSRSSMWRYGFKTPPNYDDNQMYCGGVQVQYEQNGGRCGICGDPWNGPRPTEPPGKYANGIVVRKYKPGDTITVVVELTANHKGWMEFKLCPNDFPEETVTQECLDKYVLPLADTRTTRYIVPNQNGYQKLRFKVVLPSHIRCRACVLQWKYNAGNSWGTDAKTGRGCIGCGNQEQFYGCADIAIGYEVEIPAHKPLPADKEDEDVENTTPEVPKWHWTPRPEVEPEWPKDNDKQIQTVHRGMGTFSFMPTMNNNGMNPCMCVCKRPPLKLQSQGNDLEAKFFEGLDGVDSQVCMCMCQNNSASNLHKSLNLLVFAGVMLLFLIRKMTT
ncbi:uncharacterized protein LOC128246356 [Mya arenaria]|nr:uncharacterized protein LOC128246356 [Mya arenaria]XP_052820511.1 uncharacterized protein LOC128246356 [Mya arenaria]